MNSASKKPRTIIASFVCGRMIINDPPFYATEKKKAVHLTDTLLIVSANLPCIKGLLVTTPVYEDILFLEMFKMVVLWMKNERNLPTATQSLGFNNKIKMSVTFPFVVFNHLLPAGQRKDGLS